jgi:hypothetical protein
MTAAELLLEKFVVCSASQEIPAFCCNRKVHYHVHTSPPPVLVQSQKNPIHTLQTSFPKIYFNILSLILGGLVVTVLAIGPKVPGFKPS